MEYTKKTTFQPGKYLNVPSKDIVTDKVYHHPQDYTYNNDSNTSEQVESVVRQIEARHIDIAYDYHDWVKVGFALADEFGDMGKDYFARLSRQHPDCSDEAVDKQYRKCLESRGSGITIATFFQMAKDAGVTEQLKMADQMRWVGMMNAIKSQVEEIIWNEIVYH